MVNSEWKDDLRICQKICNTETKWVNRLVVKPEVSREDMPVLPLAATLVDHWVLRWGNMLERRLASR